MSALTGGRNTKQLGVNKAYLDAVEVAQAANMKIYQGGIVGLNAAGYGVPGSDASCIVVVGVAEMDPNIGNVSDSTGLAAGVLTLRVIQGVFKFANSAAPNVLTIADRGRPCYLVDDQTVARTNGLTPAPGGGQYISAGIVIGVDSAGLVDVFLALQNCMLVRQASMGAPEEISANAALSLKTQTTRLTISGTKAYTLADGQFGGQRKFLYVVSAAATPSGVVTPAHASGFTTITFGAGTGGATVDLIWDDTLATPAWKVDSQNANGGTLTIA
jgi:hypothetical protein